LFKYFLTESHFWGSTVAIGLFVHGAQAGGPQISEMVFADIFLKGGDSV